MAENQIGSIMDITLEKVRAIADTETIIGDKIVINDEITIVPVSKLSVGFASGGSDIPSKSADKLFGGGGGAGVNITPVAFLVCKGDEVKLMQIYKETDAVDKAVGMIPDLFDKVTGLFKKKDKKGADSAE